MPFVDRMWVKPFPSLGLEYVLGLPKRMLRISFLGSWNLASLAEQNQGRAERLAGWEEHLVFNSQGTYVVNQIWLCRYWKMAGRWRKARKEIWLDGGVSARYLFEILGLSRLLVPWPAGQYPTTFRSLTHSNECYN